MNYKEIDKEFNKELKKSIEFALMMLPRKKGGEWKQEEIIDKIIEMMPKDFLKVKMNKVIDECIGEEKENVWKTGTRELETEDNDEKIRNHGYNQKVKELREYKKKFNS